MNKFRMLKATYLKEHKSIQKPQSKGAHIMSESSWKHYNSMRFLNNPKKYAIVGDAEWNFLQSCMPYLTKIHEKKSEQQLIVESSISRFKTFYGISMEDTKNTDVTSLLPKNIEGEVFSCHNKSLVGMETDQNKKFQNGLNFLPLF